MKHGDDAGPAHSCSDSLDVGFGNAVCEGIACRSDAGEHFVLGFLLRVGSMGGVIEGVEVFEDVGELFACRLGQGSP